MCVKDLLIIGQHKRAVCVCVYVERSHTSSWFKIEVKSTCVERNGGVFVCYVNTTCFANREKRCK